MGPAGAGDDLAQAPRDYFAATDAAAAAGDPDAQRCYLQALFGADFAHAPAQSRAYHARAGIRAPRAGARRLARYPVGAGPRLLTPLDGS
ncbi:hypothetical protein EDC50_1883 [Vulcaniibacterium tengchongense]|uniref:Uncharacterized protein n=1 Tax=Vulcaniibacterium tengchongense TaxID=1273429 RepID=A0A3N4VAN9_9GAMM|nr:hypothetical protein EDC50_1883 [Vulcaniibacterium tengchongense]